MKCYCNTPLVQTPWIFTTFEIEASAQEYAGPLLRISEDR